MVRTWINRLAVTSQTSCAGYLLVGVLLIELRILSHFLLLQCNFTWGVVGTAVDFIASVTSSRDLAEF